MRETREYVVVQDGWLLGRWHEAGARVALTDAQATWELLSGRVRPLEEAASQQLAETAQKTRAKRKGA